MAVTVVNDAAVSVKRFGAVGDGTTANAAAFAAALAAADCVVVPDPEPGQFYRLESALTIPAGKTLKADGDRPTLKFTGDTHGIVIGGDGASVVGLTIDGDKTSKSSGKYAVNFGSYNDCTLRDCEVKNAKSYGANVAGARNTIEDCYIHDGDSYGVVLNGAAATENIVRHNRFNNTSIGCLAFGGANRNEISFNWCTTNGRELVGITYDSWGNRVIGNRAKNTGDNGLSITGYLNTVVGNVLEDLYYWGIWVGGERNVIVGNQVFDPGRYNVGNGSPIADLAAIGLVCDFGGRAHKNTIQGNVLEETRGTSVVTYGIVANSSRYTAYTTSLVVTAGAYVLVGGARVYRIMVGGTTVDGTGPTHMSGDAVLDGITYRFCTSLIKNQDQKWVQHAAGVVTAVGDWCFHLSNIYRATVGGTTGASSPTHTSGTASDGGVTWAFVETCSATMVPSNNDVSGNQLSGFLNEGVNWTGATPNTGREGNRIRMRIAGRQSYGDIDMVRATPVGSLSREIGSLALRVDLSTTPGAQLWVKESGVSASTTGWAPVTDYEQTKSSGYTLVYGDKRTIITATAALTLTVPAVGTLGNGWGCFFLNDSGSNCTIDGPGGTNLTVADKELAIIRESNGKQYAGKIAMTLIS